MDYKEFYQNCYEELEEELGRKPTWEEVSQYQRDRMSDIVAAYECIDT
jgi:hypothetical protein